MGTYVPWSAVVWTLKGLFCTWRFFWVNPYCAMKSAPWIPHHSKNDCCPPEKNITETQEECHRHKSSSTLHKRLLNAEREIQDLKSQVASHRALWEMRFVELQKRQHDLRDQLHSETVVRLSALHRGADSAEMSETFIEPGLENGHDFKEETAHYCSSDLNKVHLHTGLNEECLNSPSCSHGLFSPTADSRSTSAMSVSTSMGSWRSGTGPHRAFVPHSPMDLQIGHRVKVLLPSGRISTGTLRYLGQLCGSSDIHLGVELDVAANGKQTGTYQGQSYFECNTGHGAFVAFSKLLMAWE